MSSNDFCADCSRHPTMSSSFVINDKTQRPSWHEYFLNIALVVATRSTCLRSAYGAVAVINNNIVSTGYNGARVGAPNCCDIGGCQRESAESRKNYEGCPAVHAEANAVLRRKSSVEGATIYLAGFSRLTGEPKVGEKCHPCVRCFDAMVQARIGKLYVYDENAKPYGGPLTIQAANLSLKKLDVIWENMPKYYVTR